MLEGRTPGSRIDRSGGNRAGELLERGDERRRLAEALFAAREGAGTILIFEGPAGIGKSRLLAEASGLADEAGLEGRRARATELERGYPFGVVRQLLTGALHEAEPEARAELLSGAAGLAERVLGDGEDATFSAPTSDAQFAVLHGLHWLLANLSERRPQLLCVDDLHWADEGSLRLLAYLAPRLNELPVVVCAGLRVGEHGPYSGLIDALLAEPASQVSELEPLSEEASRALLDRWVEPDFDAELAEAAHETTAGNPFLLRLLAGELTRDSLDGDSTPATVERIRSLGPRTVSRTVRVQIERVGRAAPEVATALAVLGDGADPLSVAELSGHEPEVAAEAADELSRAGLIEPEPLGFVHPVVRNAIYEEVGARRRSQLHSAAAKLLARTGAPPEQIASHYLLCDPALDPEAVAALRRAAEVAMDRGAPSTAAEYLSRALAEPPSEGERPGLLFSLGAAQARAGEQGATDNLSRAAETAEDVGLRLAAAVELGQALAYANEIDGAVAAMRRSLASLSDESRDQRRVVEMMLLVLAQTDVAGRGGAEQLLAEAGAVVDRHGEEAPLGLLAITALERALVDGTAEETARLASAALEESRILEEQGPESPHACGAAIALAISGDLLGAERHLSLVMDEAARRGSSRAFAFAAATRAWVRSRRGALADAEADARACLELSSDPVWDLFKPLALSALVEVAICRGDLPRAWEELERAPLGDPRYGTVFHQPLSESVGNLLLAGGEPDRALESVERCAEWERGWGAGTGAWVPWRLGSARAHQAAGRQDEAVALSGEQVELCRGFGAGRQLAEALRVDAQLGGDGGAGAIAKLEEGLDALGPDGYELERARTLIALGAAMRRHRRKRDSREPLTRGLDLARSCGASALETQALDELEAAGARPRRTATGDEHGLTPRERQVAEKAAEGLSNPEIAQVLFVTRKTVEAHLRAVFRKLDVASRAEIADRLGDV
ncbi:MAG TPA: AAA family ATPase [Solirubrobacterales bacterium]|nr:AAA family ATPase [Solirubrobacterales bacterium]